MDEPRAPRQLSHHAPGLPGVIWGRFENEGRLWRGMKDRYAFVVTISGRSEVWYRGRAYQQGPGMIQLKEPGEVHRDLSRDGPATFEVVLIDTAIVEAGSGALGGRAPRLVTTPLIAASDPRAAALIRLHALARRREADAPPLAAQGALAEAAGAIVAMIASSPEPRRERTIVRRARAYLLDRLADPVTLDDLADHVGMDKFHLARAFRADVGMPPYEFLIHARLLRARELLAAGLGAAEVATMVGFYDQSQLHRHFRRIIGMTPGQYRASCRRRSIVGSRAEARREAQPLA